MNSRFGAQALLATALSALGLTLVLTGLVSADWRLDLREQSREALSVAANSLDRDLEPVIVTGVELPAYAGVAVDDLFVYAVVGSTWSQIPAQVDEVTASGVYTSYEDGLLDDNDEIVFMSADSGDQGSPGGLMAGTLPISNTWYEIEITDPVSPSHKGWAYLFRSSVLTPTFATDYVDFDGVQHRINGTTYSLGLGTTHPTFEYLALQGSAVDLLDRTKLRLYSWLPFLPMLKEDDLGPLPDKLIKDGSVRVIVRGGNGLAYGSMVYWELFIPALPPFYGDSLRYSSDFSADAVGATLYNSAVPGGVTVDGQPDAVPGEPLSPWWQLSTADGTVLLAGDSSGIGGTQTNYYLDDELLDPDDTGDQRSFGDVGVHVAAPNSFFVYPFALYSLPGSQPNLGTEYQAYFEQALVAVATFGRPLTRIHLPVVWRDEP